MRNGCKRSRRRPSPRRFELESLENRVVLSGTNALLAETALVRIIDPNAEIIGTAAEVGTCIFEENRWLDPSPNTFEESRWLDPDQNGENKFAAENPGVDPETPRNDRGAQDRSSAGFQSPESEGFPDKNGNFDNPTVPVNDFGVVPLPVEDFTARPDLGDFGDVAIPDPDSATFPHRWDFGDAATADEFVKAMELLDGGDAAAADEFVKAMELLDGGDAATAIYLQSLNQSLTCHLPDVAATLMTSEAPPEWARSLASLPSVATDLAVPMNQGTSKAAGADLLAFPPATGLAMASVSAPAHQAQVLADRGAVDADLGQLVPLTSDLVHDVLPLDLASLETGVQEFFAQIESLGRQLAGTPAGAQLYLWFVAAATASTAFEVARRQVKQPSYRLALAAGGRGDTWTWFPGWASSHSQG